MPKTVTMPDGTVIDFPDTLDDKAIHAEGVKYMQSKGLGGYSKPRDVSLGEATVAQGTYRPEDVNKMLEGARYVLPPVAGKLAGAGALYSGVGAPLAVGADIGTQTVVDLLLKKLKGEGTDTGQDALESLGGSITNTALGGVFNKTGKWIKGYKAAKEAEKLGVTRDLPEIMSVEPTSAQALKAIGRPVKAAFAKGLEDLALTAKEKALDRVGGNQFTAALRKAKDLDFVFNRDPEVSRQLIEDIVPQNNEILGGIAQNLSKLTATIKNSKKLEQVLDEAEKLGIDKQVYANLRGFEFMRIFNKATQSSAERGNPALRKIVRIDPDSINASWYDDKMISSYKKLYTAKQRADISQFFKGIEETQDKISPNPIAKKIWMLHSGVGLASSLISGSVTAGAISGLTSVGVFLGAQHLGKLLTKPETARLLVRMAGQEPLGVSEQYAGRVLAKALQGATVGLIQPDGSMKQAMINEKNQIIPIEQAPADNISNSVPSFDIR